MPSEVLQEAYAMLQILFYEGNMGKVLEFPDQYRKDLLVLSITRKLIIGS